MYILSILVLAQYLCHYFAIQLVHKVTLDLLEEPVNLKVEWNSATVTSGAPYVMMPGVYLTPQWYADSWDSQHQVG